MNEEQMCKRVKHRCHCFSSNYGFVEVVKVWPGWDSKGVIDLL